MTDLKHKKIITLIILSYLISKREEKMTLADIAKACNVSIKSTRTAIDYLRSEGIIAGKGHNICRSTAKAFEVVKNLSRRLDIIYSYIYCNNNVNVARRPCCRHFNELEAKSQVKIKKSSDVPKKFDERAQKVAYYLAKKIKENFPKITPKPKDIEGEWTVQIERLHRIDGWTYEQIIAVVAWSQDDGFWKANIRSGGKLREKFPTLYAQITAKASVEKERQQRIKERRLTNGDR